MKNFSLNIKKSSLRGNLLAALLMVTASLLFCGSAWADRYLFYDTDINITQWKNYKTQTSQGSNNYLGELSGLTVGTKYYIASSSSTVYSGCTDNGTITFNGNGYSNAQTQDYNADNKTYKYMWFVANCPNVTVNYNSTDKKYTINIVEEDECNVSAVAINASGLSVEGAIISPSSAVIEKDNDYVGTVTVPDGYSISSVSFSGYCTSATYSGTTVTVAGIKTSGKVTVKLSDGLTNRTLYMYTTDSDQRNAYVWDSADNTEYAGKWSGTASATVSTTWGGTRWRYVTISSGDNAYKFIFNYNGDTKKTSTLGPTSGDAAGWFIYNESKIGDWYNPVEYTTDVFTSSSTISLSTEGFNGSKLALQAERLLLPAGKYDYRRLYKGAYQTMNIDQNSRGNLALSVSERDDNNVEFTLAVSSYVTLYYDPGYDVVFADATAAPTGEKPTVLLAGEPVVSGAIVSLSGYLKLTACKDVTEYGFIWSKNLSDINKETPTGTTTKATTPTAPILSGSGAGTEFSEANIEFEGLQTYYYKTYATNSVGTSYSSEYGQFSTSGCAKPVVSAITVPATICGNDETFVAEATATGEGNTYAWSATGVFSIDGTPTTSSATIAVSGTGVGSISVKPTSGTGCEGDQFTRNNIEAVDIALADPVISGDASVCQGVASMQFTVTAAGATTYAWTVEGTGWSISSGSDAATVTVVPGSTDGTVSVTVSNTCHEKNANKSVTLNHVPAKPTFKTAPEAVCKGVKTTYELNDVTGAEEIVWILPKGWEGSCDKDSKLVLKATAEDDALSGIIKAKGTNSCGSGAFSDNVSVTVGNPSIILSGEGPKPSHSEVTYPWEVLTITATGTDVELNWSVEYVEGGEVKAVTPENVFTNPTNKTAKFKAGGPISNADHFTVKASGTASGCTTITPYDIYINNDADEVCD